MDLSRLARPAILCQCSRCSSSLAALENEWAKLSSSYAIAAGWLSVELHRMSISKEKKQVPQNSEMSLLRGRILQEVACKLCQQKLGVLCLLDDGPNIFWKLTKVSFREIVSMRTVEPLFKDGSLERLIGPPPQEPRRESKALVPANRNEVDTYNMSMEQQIQHQSLSLDHISNSVNILYDTMSELKQSFTALRIELNGPGLLSSDNTGSHGNDFDMIRTVLKELRSKSEEIEKLKLEIEALKLKNRFMEEQTVRNPNSMSGVEATVAEVRSPGLLQSSRKRPWPDSFPSGRTQPIADSFDEEEEDTFGDFSLADMHMQSVDVSLNDTMASHSTTNLLHEHPTSGSPQLRIEVTQSRPHTPQVDKVADETPGADTDKGPAVVKRPRISQPVEKPSSSGNLDRKKAGRPRKSIDQAPKPDANPPENPKPTPLTEQNVNTSTDTQPERIPLNDSPSEGSDARVRASARSRTLRSRSRPPSARLSGNGPAQRTDGNNATVPDAAAGENGALNISNSNTGNRSSNLEMHMKENAPASMKDANKNSSKKNETGEQRKAQVAARDLMARLAMQREEAMETEQAR
ncbi:uncharacterized protein ACLA_072540 [Aspergillus clavatus NRRL 1]|uniref:Uncharacterized protein n=1 Tax=Aspergillus clavatus (strain ATCC 1007 / CBS 513.65 / DSM 816 / NCTC 3887 / NRRL 1 / QM 1276 / 107) TaxID=344612 RepID=A1C750_ASPCL|nr:uncharacterized protein ACLA_072540 [Aspergillus clavatus NRRL 1]EAW14221.1 conserved hypothetical protein [Aspergillus clavatus NRRL 1]